jgi:cobyrinic acid a,c-diamide synthase
LTLSIPRIVIAGTHSGVGKTSLSLALVSALKRRGFKVQTFKTGPDFLDPTYLALASGRPCYNLDGWMSGSRDYVCRLFGRVAEDADLAVIEGAMGLFDGADPATIEGSTAEIAKWLHAPVLLMANVHGLGRSLAAMVKGYAAFEPGVNLAGVVANQCGSEVHADWLALSLQASSLPPLLGGIPRGGFPQLPSRHLGLVTADALHLTPASLEALAHTLEEHVSLESLLRLARSAPLLEFSSPERKAVPKRLRLAFARDRAFHFYYQDLFDELESGGCELIPFSPVEDQGLPGCDALYIGGGYPEEQAQALSANKPMLEAIRQFALLNRPIYGECGGLMYLAKSLRTGDGREYPMVGLLPAETRMRHRRKALGYVEITLKEDSLWGARGTILRGHEFHYSELLTDPAGMPGWQAPYTMRHRRAESVRDEGFQRGRVLLSYVHLHLASHPEAVRFFIDHCGENS